MQLGEVPLDEKRRNQNNLDYVIQGEFLGLVLVGVLVELSLRPAAQYSICATW
jgi:hypothetical protein